MSDHVYLSTSCWHNLHDYCKAVVNDYGNFKKPATCKFCDAPCICTCHRVDDLKVKP